MRSAPVAEPPWPASQADRFVFIDSFLIDMRYRIARSSVNNLVVSFVAQDFVNRLYAILI
jgi:hypothetical protein